MDSSNLSRRTFIKNSAAATAAAMAVPTVLNAQATQATTGPERPIAARLHRRRRPDADAPRFGHEAAEGDGKVEIATVCDVFNRYRDEVVAKVGPRHQAQAEGNRRLPRHHQRPVDRRRRASPRPIIGTPGKRSTR